MKYMSMAVKIVRGIVMLALPLMCYGCQTDDVVENGIGADAITFELYSNNEEQSSSPSTRAADKPIVLLSENGTDSLTLYMTVANTIDLRQPTQQIDDAITRGTPITNDNLMSKCSGEIALDAFYLDNVFIDDVLSFDGDGKAHTPTPHHWPAAKDAKIDFWSYHPKEICDAADANFTYLNGDTPSLRFYYSQMGENGALVDVKDQKDMFLAYTNQGQEQGTVSLEYDHALSAIKFVAGKALEGKIKNIKLTDVYAAGTLTYTPNETTKLSWELDNDSKAIINQDFDNGIDENTIGSSTQDITRAAETFLLIPQSATGKRLTIEYHRPDGTVDTYSATMPDGVWEIGKTYTYTLRLMDGLDIEAEAGSVSNKTVNGIEIANTYSKPCYVRAMIMANWVDEDGNIADILNPDEIDIAISSGNSNYQLAAEWSTYWFYDATTNIYYYKKPLRSATSTEVKLFNRFTNSVTHSEGLTLDFTVFVQAVEADAAKNIVSSMWGNDVASKLEGANN